MKIFSSSRVLSWARFSAAAVAVGTLLAVQVANVDRLATNQGDAQGNQSTELVATTHLKSASTKATYPIQAERAQQSSTDMAAAALTSGSTFYAIPPYRSYDSRVDPDGPLLAGQSSEIKVSTALLQKQMIPETAVAITYNLTVTGTKGTGGYLALFPAGQPWPGNSSINWWTSGLDLANGGVVALGVCPVFGSGCVEVLSGPVPGTATDFIIDVTGYYAP